MAKKKTEAEGVSVDPEKTTKMQYVLKESQVQALRKEAHRRSEEDKTYRPDASALLREIIDGWLAKSGKR